MSWFTTIHSILTAHLKLWIELCRHCMFLCTEYKCSVLKLIISLPSNAISQTCAEVYRVCLSWLAFQFHSHFLSFVLPVMVSWIARLNIIQKGKRIISWQIHSWLSLSCTPHGPKGPINQNQIQLVSHSPWHIFYSLLSAQQSFVSM